MSVETSMAPMVPASHTVAPRLLRRVNPLALLLGSMVATLPLTVSLDWVSAGVALVCEVVVLLVAGVRPATMLRRMLPVLLIAPAGAINMALYAQPGGREYFSFLLAHVTDNSLTLMVAVLLRICAVALPVVVIVDLIDPTELADALSQLAKLPARFVLGVMAGVRLVGLFMADWRILTEARRARGLGDRGWLRRWFSMAFAMLVLALRRAATLATAMEARGFGAGGRTWARPSRWSGRDTAVMVVSTLMVAVALGAAAAAGTLRFWWS